MVTASTRRFDPERYPDARRQTRAALGFGEDDLVVGMVTRLVREKGCVEFFEMAARVAERNSRVRFLLVGIPERREQSDAIDAAEVARQFGVEERCVLLEDRQDMPELYMSMDLCVLPSYREGCRAVFEAGAMGAAAGPGYSRLSRGHSGRRDGFFSAKRRRGICRSSERVLADEKLRAKLARGGQFRVRERYVESLVTERVVGLYKSGLGA